MSFDPDPNPFRVPHARLNAPNRVSFDHIGNGQTIVEDGVVIGAKAGSSTYSRDGYTTTKRTSLDLGGSIADLKGPYVATGTIVEFNKPCFWVRLKSEKDGQAFKVLRINGLADLMTGNGSQPMRLKINGTWFIVDQRVSWRAVLDLQRACDASLLAIAEKDLARLEDAKAKGEAIDAVVKDQAVVVEKMKAKASSYSKGFGTIDPTIPSAVTITPPFPTGLAVGIGAAALGLLVFLKRRAG